jgi:hypothetical protein
MTRKTVQATTNAAMPVTAAASSGRHTPGCARYPRSNGGRNVMSGIQKTATPRRWPVDAVVRAEGTPSAFQRGSSLSSTSDDEGLRYRRE